jgi:ascorbate-specific PTS system EIIC-type component UlaA
MLETHIVMSSLIFHLILTLMLCLISLRDLTIAHMILLHGRIAFYLDALVLAHVLIVMIIFCKSPVFLLEGLALTQSLGTLTVHIFSHRDTRPIGPSDEVLKTVKTS